MILSSRERVFKTLNHIEPDRVPIDNGGFVSGMHEIAYKNFLKYLKIEDKIEIYDPVQRLARVSNEVLDYLGVDTRYIFPNNSSTYEFKENKDGSFEDEFGAKFKRMGNYCENYYSPLEGASFKKVKKYKFPDPDDSARYKGVRERALRLYKKTDYALVSAPVNSLFYWAWCLRGMEGFLTDTVINPDTATYILDKLLEYNIKFYDNYLNAIGDLIEYFWIGDDWGTKSGPLVNPDYFRKEIVPRYKKIIYFCKTKTKAKCIYHTCGATYWCLSDLIEMGIDIVHPLQPNAMGNEDSEKIKREYGDRLSFQGAINDQGLFHKKTELMLIDTLKRIKYLAPGGGYIFSSGHHIEANYPPQKISMLFDYAKEFGKYPIDIDGIDKEIKKLERSLEN